jgi:hypothetical protein
MSKTNITSKFDHGLQGRELSEQELDKVSGGDGPPGTAGDGNGRAMHGDLQVHKYLDKASYPL